MLSNNIFYLNHIYRSTRVAGEGRFWLERTSPRSWHGRVGPYEFYLDWIFKQPNAREALAEARFLEWRGR